MTSATGQQYSLGPVLPITYRAAYIIGPMFGIKTIYGWRKSDPFPDHPSGHALDFMIPNTDTGNRLAAFAQANAGPLGVKYIIWNRQYWGGPGQAWVPYTQTSNPHTDHVHITFLDRTTGGDVNPTAGIGAGAGVTDASLALNPGQALGTLAQADTCAWSITLPKVSSSSNLGPIPLPSVSVGGEQYCVISKKQLGILIGGLEIFGGVVIGIVGLAFLMVAGLSKSNAGNVILNVIPGAGAVKRLM